MVKSITSKTKSSVVTRTKPSAMSDKEFQSSRLASFQITKGNVKTYLQYYTKETKDGLKCEKIKFYYMKVPNDRWNARKDEVFVYMDAKTRNKLGLKESRKEMSFDKALKEINSYRTNVSPNLRNGVRLY